jgi:hypothetical protein
VTGGAHPVVSCTVHSEDAKGAYITSQFASIPVHPPQRPTKTYLSPMDLRCQYASSHCCNTRSLKISGELHRFCLFHRRNANAAQRRWKQKKLTEAVSGSGEDDTTRPSVPASKFRRRLHSEARYETSAKRRRQSRQIAMPRTLPAIQPNATPSITVMPMLPPAPPVPAALDDLPPLFANDTLLDELIASVDGDSPENAFSVAPDVDRWWWANLSYQQDVGVIV